MRKRCASAYISDHPLWRLVTPKYQVLLTTPQHLKVYSTATSLSVHEYGSIAVERHHPTQLLVTTQTVYHLPLDQSRFTVGYAALEQLSCSRPVQANPRQYASIETPHMLVILQFNSEAACEQWSQALTKLLAAVNQQANEEPLGCLFDITLLPSRSQNWCELRLSLVTEDNSSEEFVLCDLAETPAEERLQQLEERLGGKFDCVNAGVLLRYLEDVSILQELGAYRTLYASIGLRSSLPFDKVTPNIAEALKATISNQNWNKGQMTLRIAVSGLHFTRKEPLSKAFQVAHIQKLYNTFTEPDCHPTSRQRHSVSLCHSFRQRSSLVSFQKLLDIDRDEVHKRTQKPRLTTPEKFGTMRRSLNSSKDNQCNLF